MSAFAFFSFGLRFSPCFLRVVLGEEEKEEVQEEEEEEEGRGGATSGHYGW